MRYAVIMAGGSGTRLWPMSRSCMPKQLIPFIGGRSLIQLASDRLTGLVPSQQQYVCAGQTHRDAILAALPNLPAENYLAEPEGRDTLGAVGYMAAVLGRDDPDAVIAVFTADHLIEPVEVFQETVRQGYELAESAAQPLVTFGITPTHPATAYGYLQLGEPCGPTEDSTGRHVTRFKEKPDEPVAKEYLAAGSDRYLWNSGMFVWRASSLLGCIKRYHPALYASLQQIADAWGTDRQQPVLDAVYPTLEKISVDFGVMEPASTDPAVTVGALPMAVTWLDVGSWPAYAQTCERDEHGNAMGVGRHLLVDTTDTLVASSDPQHVIATLGCDDLIVIHTAEATLVCHRDQAEKIKSLHAKIREAFGDDLT